MSSARLGARAWSRGAVQRMRRRCRPQAAATPPRSFATAAAPQVFDRQLKVKQRARAARATDSQEYDYLRDEVARRLGERLQDVSVDLQRVLDLGAHHGALLPELRERPGVDEIVMLDSCEALLQRDVHEDVGGEANGEGPSITRIVADEELLSESAHDALREGSFDCVVSSLSLHWVNDLPGVLLQARRLLRPDGLFLGAMLGGSTLQQLRVAMSIAEQERDGGLSARCSPLIRVEDVAALLTRAGYKLLTVDVDEITVPYPDALTLMHELRGMGEGNAVHMRRTHLPRDTLAAAAAIYHEMYAERDEDSGEVVLPATFEVIYMIGWAPSARTPQPLERGTGQVSLKDELGGGCGGGGGAARAGAEEGGTALNLQDIADETGGHTGRVTEQAEDVDVASK